MVNYIFFVYSILVFLEITKKVYNNIMNSIQLQYKMDTIFMNSQIVKDLILID